MKKKSSFNLLYRFFDIIILIFLIFNFGYNIAESHKSHNLIGLLIFTVCLFVFNTIKYFFYKNKTRKDIALRNAIIIFLLLFISLIIAFINRDLNSFQILKSIKPILEGGLLFYFILRLMNLVRYIYAVYYNPAIIPETVIQKEDILVVFGKNKNISVYCTDES